MQSSTLSSPQASELEVRLAHIEEELRKISVRNERVELNKAWETSRIRMLGVTSVTYVTMILIFVVLGSARPYLDALVPTSGFLLSTLSLPVIRNFWESKAKSRKKT
jgi:hypothetical protein